MKSNTWVVWSLFGLLAAASVPGCADNTRAGDCEPACAATQECCDGTCVFMGLCNPPGMDSGTTPPGTDSGPPVTTMCTPECTDQQRCCGGSCIQRAVPPDTDGRSDPSFGNCNGCGIACDSMRASSCSVPGGGEGMARCLCGAFEQCLAGEACVNEGGSFICISTSTDPNNCGEIGNMCATGESCVAGACVCGSSGAACSAGQACCAGSCVDTTMDPANCGGCGTVCTPESPQCMGGSCICPESGRACDAPMAGAFGMGGSLGETCCPGVGCVANSDTSCGCEMCTGEDTCQVGGSGFIPGGMGEDVATVCCGDSSVAFLGCGGFPFPFPGGGDGGLPFPGGDGGVPFP